MCLILFSTILVLTYLISGFCCEVNEICTLLGCFSYTLCSIAEKCWSFINVLLIICSWFTSTRMQSDIEHTKLGYSNKFLFKLTVFFQSTWWDTGTNVSVEPAASASLIYQTPWCHIPAHCAFVVTTIGTSNLPWTTVSSQDQISCNSVAGRNVTKSLYTSLKSHSTYIEISMQSVIFQVENKLTYALKSLWVISCDNSSISLFWKQQNVTKTLDFCSKLSHLVPDYII